MHSSSRPHHWRQPAIGRVLRPDGQYNTNSESYGLTSQCDSNHQWKNFRRPSNFLVKPSIILFDSEKWRPVSKAPYQYTILQIALYFRLASSRANFSRAWMRLTPRTMSRRTLNANAKYIP